MVMMAQTSFNGGILSPRVQMRIDQPRYQNGVEDLLNMIPEIQGPAKRRPGLEFCGAVKTESSAVRLIEFIFSEEQSYVLEFGDYYMRVWYDGKLILSDDGKVFELPTPYTSEMILKTSYVQSADLLYMCNEFLPPKRLERRGHNVWAIVDVVTGSSQISPIGLVASASGSAAKTRKYSYVVTAVNDENNEESVASAVANVDAAESLTSTDFVSLTWDTLPNVSLYNVYKDRSESGIYGYIGSAGTTGKLVDRGVTPSAEDRPPAAKQPFSGGNNPTTVTFFQQRLVFAGSNLNPLTVDFSQTAAFQNFNVSNPVKADDSIKLTLASGQQNKIVWIYGGRRLQVGTVGGEWLITGANEEPLKPDNPDARNIGSSGSSRLMPIYISGRTLFCQRDGHTIRELTYDYVSDSYVPSNQIVFADALFEGKTIVDWAYQQSPYTCVWCVLNDGTIAGFTYNIEHQVSAWHRHTTDGFVESITSIPHETQDDVYLVVRREINGEQRRFVERMRPYFDYTEEKESFFVDSGVTVKAEEGKTISYIEGLTHLAGKTVSILTDGYVLPEKEVDLDGKLELGKEVSIATVGLPFESSLVPLTKEFQGKDGSNSILVPRSINSLRIKFFKSIGGKYQVITKDRRGNNYFGPESEIIPRIGDETGALPASSGIVTLGLEGNCNERSTIKIKQVDPLPMTILAISMNMEGGTV